MKITIGLLALGMMAAPAFAQNGIYVSASAGIGLGNAADGRTYEPYNKVTRPGSMVYNGKIVAGYQFSNWRIQTGIQYFTSQYKTKGGLFNSDIDPTKDAPIHTSYIHDTYQHLGVPLQMGYVLRSNKKLHIVPYFGIIAGYNMGNKEKVSISDEPAVTHKWTSKDFDANYNRISLWGTAALQLEYKLSEKISIVAGPSVQYMVSNFRDNPSGVVFKSTQRNYAINLDAGVTIRL